MDYDTFTYICSMSSELRARWRRGKPRRRHGVMSQPEAALNPNEWRKRSFALQWDRDAEKSNAIKCHSYD